MIGVTADRRADEQCEMLRRRGARVLHGPSVCAVPLAPDIRMRAATEALIDAPPAVLVANTGTGIRTWFAAAESWGLGDALLRSLDDTRILARGPKAAGAILTAGLDVTWRSNSETLAEAVSEVVASTPSGTKVAVQLDGGVEQLEVVRLRAAGFDVAELRVYETQTPADARPGLVLLNAVCDQRVDAITFTSTAAVRGFATLAQRHGRSNDVCTSLTGRVLAICVGPVSAQAATDLGFAALHPDRPRLGSMVHRLTAELSGQRRCLRLASTDVVLQGSAITIDGTSLTLTHQERSILELLLTKDGAVATRVDLLRTIWGDSTEEHALEVAITRLRKKLGTAGPALRTVIRRGYRIQID